MNLLTRLLQKWVAWILPRPRLVLGVVLCLTAGSIAVAALRLDVQTDQLQLISSNHPLIALSDKLDPFQFSGKKVFTLIVQPPTPERGIAFLNALAERINNDQRHFQSILYRINPDLFRRWVLLYLTKDELVQVRDRIQTHSDFIASMSHDPDLLNFFNLTNQEMASKMVGELFTGFLDEDESAGVEPGGEAKKSEPMDLDFLIKVLQGMSTSVSGSPAYISPWSAFFKSGAWDLDKEGYFWQAGKKFLVASVIPAKIKEGVSKTQNSLTALRKHIAALRAEGFQDVQAGVTGQEAMNNDEMHTAMQDMTLATWLSLGFVLGLRILFLRSVRNSVIIFISITVALCWTLGWAAIFIGHLNILSIVFAPLLCGLGDDYGIHWYARFDEEARADGATRQNTIKKVMDRSGPGILLAGISTAFSFLPFVLTGFSGLVELGLITGVGILFAVLAVFTVVPALSHYFAVLGKPRAAHAEHENTRYLFRLHSRGARAILAASLLLCIACGFTISRVRFDLNPLRLQSEDAESVVWEKILVENSKRSVLSASAFASSPLEVLVKSEEFRELNSVYEVENIFTHLPEFQDEKIPMLRAILAAVPEINRMGPKANGTSYASLAPTLDESARTDYTRRLIDVLERVRFKLQDDQAGKWGASRPMIEQMSQARALSGDVIQRLKTSGESYAGLSEYNQKFRNDQIDKWALIMESSAAPVMSIQDLPKELSEQLMQGGQYLVRIYPRESVWDEGALTTFVTSLRSVDPDVVGDPVSLYTFSSAFKRACVLASLYALIAFSILLLLTLKRFSLTLIALLPLVAGTIWTVGIMGLLGIDFNLANSIFMPLVVGAGVEYGVIIILRWREAREAPGYLPASTGKGVILAALTTTAGVGTLMISHHRGIFSLGFVAWAGSLCVLASAIFIVPAVFAGMKRQEAPAHALPDKER